MFVKSETRKSRREFLRTSLAALGAVALPQFLRAAEDEYESITVPSPVKSVIFLNMAGGMSHVDTFDHRPSQSPFSGVVAAGGLRFAETMKRTAAETGRIAVIRSTWSEDGDHGFAQKLLHTGYRQSQSQAFPDIPSLGAVIAYAKKRQEKGAYFPSHITMGNRGGVAGRGGFLGVRYSGFHIGNLDNPVTHLKPMVGRIAEDRQNRRGKILEMLNDDFRKEYTGPEIETWSEMFIAAREFAASEQLGVFDLTKERADVRARFGESWTGKACLMAKRLAEAGVPFIEIGIGGWDTHGDNQAKVRQITKDLDPALAALLAELGSSGLLKQTLVVLSSEFGRTPDVGTRDGRDHWARCWTTLIGGGNIPGGAVIGESDAKAQKPAKDPVHLRELVATIYKASGIDHEANPYNSMGRPFPLVPRGTSPVKGLLG